MSVNLAARYAKPIDQVYTHESYFKGKANGKFQFTGVKGLKVFSPVTVEMTPYDRDRGYGEIKRMENEVQEMVATQDMMFGLILDHADQDSANGSFAAGERLRQQLNEQVIPTQDKYTAAQYIKNAGKIVGVEKPTEKTILGMISDAGAAMDNELVPDNGRYLVIGATLFGKLRLADQVIQLEKTGTSAVEKGVVGEIMGFKAVKVPDRYLPTNAYFMCFHSDSVVYPTKIFEARMVTDSETHSADKLLGRFFYDAFVLARKSGGVYAAVASASKQATPEISVSGNTATITSAGATSVKVTTDGSDPRYSQSALTVTTGGTVNVESGQTVKAVAYGTFTSDVAEKAVG